MSRLKTEVLIIGGGVLGAVVARELSKYKVDVTLVEKEVDFGWGSTKASANIVCQGADSLEFRKEYHRSKLVWSEPRRIMSGPPLDRAREYSRGREPGRDSSGRGG